MPPDVVLEGETRSAPTPGRGPFARIRSWFANRRRASVERPEHARRRIALWVMSIGLVSGFINLPMPLEAGYQLIRDSLRLHPADGQTVLVMIDDKSLDELGVRDPLRGDDAKLVDGLFAAGASRIFFDRAYADASTKTEDQKLIDAFGRHRGNVFVGSLPVVANPSGGTVSVLTHPRFMGKAEMVSMHGKQRVFGLTWYLPVSSEIAGRRVPSISAKLAGVQDGSDDLFRPDFSIDYNTIPKFSYVDVLKGKVPSATFAGKDVMIAPANMASPDSYLVPFRDPILGAQIHALGAETLREKRPVSLGWFPALAVVLLFVFAQSRRKIPTTRGALLLAGVMLGTQAVLDLVSVHFDVMTALMCLTIGAVRLRNLANKTYRGETGLVKIERFYSRELHENCDVIALKIRNFATISACLSPREIDDLLEKAEAMLRSAEGGSQFGFHKDTLVWLRDRIPEDERVGHLRGLHAVFRSSVNSGANVPDMATSLGLDPNYGLTLRERTENAIQSAEDAAHHGSVFEISGSEGGEDRAWRLRFFSELELAIANGDIKVMFQPKVSLATRRIVGAEALVRWTHPERGPIEPSQIVAYAEEHNRIEVITRFVLDRALADARQAIAIDPEFRVAVNISALDLRDASFLDDVRAVLTRYDFPAGNLVLEITETAPIENDRIAGELLVELKRMGILLSVDDFGTGHASLHYLRQIPSDEVKIDRSFVGNLHKSAEDRMLVKTAIEMIHSLRRYAVAEGVEDEEVVRLLTEMGCDAAQGFFFSKAVRMDHLLSELKGKSRAA